MHKIMNARDWKLIAKKLANELSDEEEKAFTHWLQSDPSNHQEFRQAEQLWKASGGLHKYLEPDTEKAWQRFKEKAEAKQRIEIFSLNRLSSLKVAAAVALLTTLSIVLVYIFSYKTAPPPILAEIITTDSSRVLYLPDSTRITINKQSRLAYPIAFTAAPRTVYLTGEAFFEVTPDSQKPFIVAAGPAEIRVLGTSFNVKAREEDEEINVIVATGKVQVAADDKTNAPAVIVTENEQVTYNRKNATMTKQKPHTKDIWWEKTDFEKEVKKLFNKGEKELKRLKQRK